MLRKAAGVSLLQERPLLVAACRGCGWRRMPSAKRAVLCQTGDTPRKSRKSPERSPPLSLCTLQTRSSGEGLTCSRALSEPAGCRSPCRAASHGKALHQPSLLLPRVPEPRGHFSPRPAPSKPPFLLCSSVPTASQAHLLQEPAHTAAPEFSHV